MTDEQLEKLDDDGLKRVIAQAKAFLAKRAEEREAQAVRDAGELLASVGLTLKPAAVRRNGKSRRRRANRRTTLRQPQTEQTK